MEKKDYLDQADKSKHWEQRNSPALEYLKILKHYDKNPEGKTLLDVGCAEGVEVNEFRKQMALMQRKISLLMHRKNFPRLIL